MYDKPAMATENELYMNYLGLVTSLVHGWIHVFIIIWAMVIFTFNISMRKHVFRIENDNKLEPISIKQYFAS